MAPILGLGTGSVAVMTLADPVSPAQWISDIQQGLNLRTGRSSSRLFTLFSREPQFASYASTGELAARAQVHPSSVTRLAQSLGYDGWPDLREALRNVYIRSVGSLPDTTTTAGTDFLEQSLGHDAESIQGIRAPDTTQQLREIGKCLYASNRTVVLGSGLAAAPAQILGYLSLMAGLDVRLALGSATSQAAEVARLGEGDCIIAINLWRTTKVLYELLELARERKVTICVMTDIVRSRLAAMADHTAVVPSSSVAGIPSATAMCAAAQAITVSAMQDSSTEHGRLVEASWEALKLMDERE